MDIGVEDNKKKDLTKSMTILTPNQTQEYKYSCQPHKEALQNKLQKGTQCLKAVIL